MMRNKFFIFFLLLLLGCVEPSNEKDNYPKNNTISNAKGVPNDSLTFYYPTSIYRDSQIIKIEIDTFKLNWYSSILFCAGEPVLFNYYQKHDIYRFLWIRSFHKPMVFSLHKDGGKIWLVTKELDKIPQFMDHFYVTYPPLVFTSKGEIDTTKRGETKIDSVVKANRQAKIILNQTKQLSNKEWIEFESLLNNCAFWTTAPTEEILGVDGSGWIIEGHLKNKYWFVDRWSPKDRFFNAGEYLIRISGLNEEIY